MGVITRKEVAVANLKAKDIMHPRVSISEKMAGEELVSKMMTNYPALPVVNDNLEVIGTVSDSDILDAIRGGRTIHEFSAETVMNCGHAEHHQNVCRAPVTVSPDTSINDVVDKMYSEHLSILPVVDGKKLIGVISRKNIINALSEKGLWPETDFQKRI